MATGIYPLPGYFVPGMKKMLRAKRPSTASLKNPVQDYLKDHFSVMIAAGATLIAAVCVGLGLFARRNLAPPSIMEALVKYNPQGF